MRLVHLLLVHSFIHHFIRHAQVLFPVSIPYSWHNIYTYKYRAALLISKKNCIYTFKQKYIIRNSNICHALFLVHVFDAVVDSFSIGEILYFLSLSSSFLLCCHFAIPNVDDSKKRKEYKDMFIIRFRRQLLCFGMCIKLWLSPLYHSVHISRLYAGCY